MTDDHADDLSLSFDPGGLGRQGGGRLPPVGPGERPPVDHDSLFSVSPTDGGGPRPAAAADATAAWEEHRARLDELARAYADRETRERIRRLLDQAQDEVDAGRYRSAHALIDQALEDDPENIRAWLLDAHCRIELGDVDAALRRLLQARRQRVNGHEAAAIDALVSVCEVLLLQEIEADLYGLISEQRFDDAVALIERRLTSHPTSGALHYRRCQLLVEAGRVTEARLAMQQALGTLSEREAEPCQRLLWDMTRRDEAERLENIRALLRRRSVHRAARELEACLPLLGDDPHVKALRAYVHQRRTTSIPLGVGRLVHRSRGRVDELGTDDRQKVLRWVVQEEITAATDAAAHSEYSTVIAACESAERIDAGSADIALLHGWALLGDARTGGRSRRPERSGTILRRARAMSVQASEYPPTRGSADRLRELIDSDLHTVAAVQERQDTNRAVNACIGRYNALVGQNRRRVFRSMVEVNAVLAELHAINREATSLRARTSPGSRDRAQLDTLTDRVRESVQRLS